ncbi:MAG: ABC transporter ATP-binding protein [Myxococcales bacterium]|nr:ABC transporter ATP-binding protein [Myxococcales bacterium]
MSHWAVETRGLQIAFGRRRVITDLQLRVPTGVVYGLLGRNGAGKTTTLRMLLGILRPDEGELVFDGASLRRGTPKTRQRIGYVSQQQHFYPWMRVRRLGRFVGSFYPTWRDELFEELLGELAIEPAQRVGELSGGTRMKLALALALAHEPPLLILDEPTAGVDPVTRREILDHLRRLVDRQGRTVLFSTHHVSEIEDIGDEVGILHEGRIFWQGPVAKLTEHVREVHGPVPEGARVLHQGERAATCWAPPSVWSAVVGASRVSLEAAFVAIARDAS